MDTHTLELLEFDKVRGLLATYAFSTLGQDLARELSPFRDPALIRAELALVNEMVEAISTGHSPPLSGLRDVRLVVRRAAIGTMLSEEQLLEVAQTLACTGNVYRFRMKLDERRGARLQEMLAAVDDMGALAKSITDRIDSRGTVVDSASPELTRIRAALVELDDRVQAEIRRLLRDPKLREILRYPNATVNGDHYVLPVAINHRQKIPGIVHRTSSTGETVFIEPASVSHLSAERIVLKGNEDREIKRILRKLSADVGKVATQLGRAIEIMAKLDLIQAKARQSLEFHHACPDINSNGRLWLRQARHPLLEAMFRDKAVRPPEPNSDSPAPIPSSGKPRSVVPIDIRLGVAYNMLIITGPNTGGKTVALKTAGLLSLMALCGLHIPAGEGSEVPVFTRILADIGDEQSLEQSLSTFSSHISRISAVLAEADEHTLVLFDELGAGTDPTEGAALGRAILDELDRLRCRAMVTTHLGDLKTYAFHNERAENAAVEFDVTTLRPTYRLHIGQFGMSNALKIARRLKLPKGVLARAHKYLRRKQKRAPEMARLAELKAQAEIAREQARAAQVEAERQAEELRQQQIELERKAKAESALREMRQKLQASDQVHVKRFDKVGKVVRVDHKRGVVTVNVGLGNWEVSLDEVFPPPGSSDVRL